MPDHVLISDHIMCLDHVTMCVDHVIMCVDHVTMCVDHVTMCVCGLVTTLCVCVDHVTADKLASYIIQGVLFPIISWPVHLLLHILKVHASHGNNDNDIAMLLLVLIANTQDCGTCQHHVCQRKQCHIMFHTCGKCP